MAPKRCKNAEALKSAVAVSAKRKEPDGSDQQESQIVASDMNCSNTCARNIAQNEIDDGDSSSDGCLHCRKVAEDGDVQVRCYDCCKYICSECHWCHEFQANHEIRVCDRCDAFYCRHCDEMDQCDDCGEVVCASCSTLLSCKFCGGGLCEECATACGRCGIVLCNRDAKFAVDCDTCRLSYCLVCLASGGKDPCVRCGHRPSKRMEQLVHLRLKSIYKAFKQSSTSPTLTSAVSVTGHHGATISTVEKHISRARGQKSKSWRERGISNDLQNSPWDDDDGDFLHDCPVIPPATDRNPFLDAEESVDRLYRYKEEQEKADAAAAALLAELEEEEEAAKSRKKKKNKKKQRQVTGQDHEGDDFQQDSNNQSLKKASTLSTRGLEKRPHDATKSDVKFADDGSLNEESAVHETKTRGQDDIPLKDTTDNLENELWNLVENSDVDGINQLLMSIRGVPGRALLRKNAKKALKRIRMDQEAELDDGADEECDTGAVEDGALSVGDFVASALEPSRELLSVVSETQVKSSTTTLGASRGRPIQAGQSSGRCECVLSMSPLIVGWVIGKGGQRIRDLMEESGARIWIDQESVGPSENRVVYVSGQRKNVDDAVHLIKDLVGKAPVSSAQTRHSAPSSDNQAVDPSAPIPRSNESPTKGLPLKSTESEVKFEPLREIGADPSKQQPDDVSSTRRVLTCDPRYVPLLIGRRGWEIKSIQDRSNAQVDIDQTVTPRRITISGTKESVAKAAELVQDVLRYPTSQLQGPTNEMVRIEQVESVASPPLQQSYAERVAAVEDGKRNVQMPVGQEKPSWPSNVNATHQKTVSLSQIDVTPSLGILKNDPRTSPPSSLIMNTDAKSTVSVSSSLSSTPEPTMSTVKSPYAQSFPLPSNMLPPMNGQLGIGGSELKIGEVNRVSHAQPDTLHPYHAFQPSALSPRVAHFNQNVEQQSAIFEQRHQLGPAAEANNPLSLFQLGPRHGLNHHLHSGLHPSEAQSFPSHNHNGLRSQGLFEQTGIHGHQQELGRFESSELPNAGLWEHPVEAPNHVPQTASDPVAGFQLDAAVDFLQNSNMQYGSQAAVGPPPGHILLGSPAKYDARIIDSLFASSGEPESSLLHGFDGLSINQNDASNSMFGLFATGGAGNGAPAPRQALNDSHPSTQIPETFPSGFAWDG
ncbi:hypothetical protein FisN_17Lh309 [Fistulifera solaris]|uniref:K Homology domain-containing protein n=1 Tax=Fistulifera solaris TaxID=1519565 RepID=A0A1Z5J5W6_FISSO|nr:hypothetical protein FisN_17Lh309 [Fistulifera solaris]|eukprot:GAX09228.1 hypothetical protein FisN_17Lh309 [Fistulifera solaris]